MKKIIFILSRGHSGSTLLDLILGRHSQCVGVGEMGLILKMDNRQLQRAREKICSCKEKGMECVFWGQVLPKLENNLPFEKKFDILYSIFQEKFGDRILIDSSKNLHCLKSLIACNDCEVSVIYLIRDVRSYTISEIDRGRKKGRKWLKRTPAHYFRKWYLWNKRAVDFLKENNLRFINVGYEDLCLRTEVVVEKLYGELDLVPESSMSSLDSSKSHILLGNRMRRQPTKLRKIQYDNRWFYRNEWVIPSILFPIIMRYNRRNVYKEYGDSLCD